MACNTKNFMEGIDQTISQLTKIVISMSNEGLRIRQQRISRSVPKSTNLVYNFPFNFCDRKVF